MNRNIKARRRQLRVVRRRTRTAAELREIRASRATGWQPPLQPPQFWKGLPRRSLARLWQRVTGWRSVTQRDTSELLNR